MSDVKALPYSELPGSYHRWKWRILLAFCVFYLFIYLGRFNFWPVAPLIKEDLALSHMEIGLINALLLWGFGLGDVVHGRLAEAYGLRLWVLVGAVLTTVFNWVTSYGTSALTIAIPWGIVGFVNAACWAPAISMISQWWPRQDRGMAMGILGTFTGGAMLLMWWVSGAVGAQFGWQAAFRYPPLIIAALGIGFYLLARDRPADVGLPEYIEEDEVSATPEAMSAERLKGFGPYKELLSNPRFQLASHVKGLENVVRYGLTTWVPIYYFTQGGLSIESTILVTFLLPLGYLLAPPLAGIISDRLLLVFHQRLRSRRYRAGAADQPSAGRCAAPDRGRVHGAVLDWLDSGRHGRQADVRHLVGVAGRPRLCLRRVAGRGIQRGAGHDGQPMAGRVPVHGCYEGAVGRHDSGGQSVANYLAMFEVYKIFNYR